jgi:hypothetical protein
MQKTLSFRVANQRARAKRGPMMVSEPGIQPPAPILFLDSGPGASRHPGMTERV